MILAREVTTSHTGRVVYLADHTARMRAFLYLSLLPIALSGQQTPSIWIQTPVDSWHLPLAKPEVSPSFPRAGHFGRIPVRPIYKGYPVCSSAGA